MTHLTPSPHYHMTTFLLGDFYTNNLITLTDVSIAMANLEVAIQNIANIGGNKTFSKLEWFMVIY